MFSKLTTTAFLILLVAPAFLADEQLPLHRRTARSVGGFFKRILFGRNKQPFQGTANVNTLYNAQQSSYFPNYASFLTQPSEQLNTAASFADYQNQLPYASNSYAPSLQSSYSQGLLSGMNSNQESNLNPQATDLSSYAANYANLNGNLASASNTPYANYAAMPSNQIASISPQNVDFNKVLDNFVRSAGLSPNGDHDTSASTNVEQKEPNSGEGTYFSIPYMRKHIKRVSSDPTPTNPQVQQSQPSAASALMNYFGGRKLSDITKFYNHNQKYLQSVPATLNASYLNTPAYNNQLKRLAYYHVQQQYAKQNAANNNQLPPEIHLINNVHLPTSNNQPIQTPNVMNQATNAYPTYTNPSPVNVQSTKQINNIAQASTTSVTQTAPQQPQLQQPQIQSVNQQQQQQQQHSSPVAASTVNQKQQALIQQAINNPQAFLSQLLTQQYSQQQPSTGNANSNLNNSNKLNGETTAVSSDNSGDLADEYSGSSYYYGQPQVSVSSSTSTKVSNHKQSAPSNPQTAHNNLNQSSSSSAVSNQQSNSNVSA